MTMTVYGVGVGPGDPSLLTLRAVEVLRAADLLIAPRATPGHTSVALDIARAHIPATCRIEETTFPMSDDPAEREAAAVSAADGMAAAARQGLTAVMVTLGDPMTYSTWGYVLQALTREHADVAAETIPGVTSYAAVAARLGEVLAEGSEPLIVWPGPLSDELADLLTTAPNIVALKTGRRLEGLVRAAGAAGARVSAARRLGMDAERVARDAAELLGEEPDYFTTAIVHKETR